MQKACKSMELGDKKYCKGDGSHIREDGIYVEAGENDNLIVSKLEANPNALGGLWLLLPGSERRRHQRRHG